MAHWLPAPPPDRLLLIDPDPELRRILLTEIAQIARLPVSGASPEECALPGTLHAAIPLCRPSKTKLVRSLLPQGVELVTLSIRSATGWLAPWTPVPKDHLIGVVSHWPEFVETARTMLIAAGIPAECLVLRDARKPRWQRGLDEVTAILCDAYTATLAAVPQKPHRIVFPLLADSAREELGRFD